MKPPARIDERAWRAGGQVEKVWLGCDLYLMGSVCIHEIAGNNGTDDNNCCLLCSVPYLAKQNSKLSHWTQ